MLKKITALLLAFTLMSALAGCRGGTAGTDASGQTGTPEASDGGWEPYTFTDAAGTEITLEERPETVAALFSSFADIWQTAGGSVDITVGESVERGFAPEGVTLVDDGAGKTINQELLLAAEPDLVLCSADLEGQVQTAAFLQAQGIPAAVFHVESVEEYLDMLKICTDITGCPENYEKYGVQVQQKVGQILASVPQLDDPRRILFVRAGSKYAATKAKTAENNFVCVMLKELGTYNIAENAPVLLDGLSQEEILLENPDYIFISTMGDETAAKAYMDSVLQEDAWAHLDAVQAGDYAYLPKDLFQFKPNSRWAEAYQYLFDLLYPEEG